MPKKELFTDTPVAHCTTVPGAGLSIKYLTVWDVQAVVTHQTLRLINKHVGYAGLCQSLS